jgi:hypothetical protein
VIQELSAQLERKMKELNTAGWEVEEEEGEWRSAKSMRIKSLRTKRAQVRRRKA